MRTFINEKIRTNPLGLNVIIVLVVLSAGGSLVGIFISPFRAFFLTNLCFSGLLVYGLLQRAEWARAIIGVLSGLSLLIMALSCLVLLIKVPVSIIHIVRSSGFSMARLFTFATTCVYLWTFIYLWRPKIRPLFCSGAPASAKRIVTRYVLPAFLVLAIFMGGGVLIFQKTFSGSNLGSLTPETARHTSSGKVRRLLMAGDIKREDVGKALFIKFPYEEWRTRTWGYQFPGFRKTELTPTETEDLISGFRQSKRFYYEIKDTIIKEGKTAAITGIWTPEMKQWQDTFDRIHEKADRAHRSGEFQVYMKNGDIGTVAVWWDKRKVGFHDIHERPWVIGFSEPMLQLVQQVSPRVQESQIEVVFPELGPQEAMRKAEKEFGDVYRRALAYVKDSKALEDRIGRIMEIRPALGPNYGDWWQGAGEYIFTFKVIGEKAQAAVKVKDTYQGDWKLTAEAIIHCEQVEF